MYMQAIIKYVVQWFGICFMHTYNTIKKSSKQVFV